MDEYGDSPRPTKRFKHQSYNQTIKAVHAPTALAQYTFDEEAVDDNDSHFRDALVYWQELNLSQSFVQFAQKVEPLCASMPLLLHHWQDVMKHWFEALEKSDDEGLKALFDLLQKLTHDLRTTLLPVYPDILQRLTGFLPKRIEASALVALLAAFSTIFKYLLILSEDAALLDQTWSTLRSTLPKCLSDIQRTVMEVWASVLRKLKAGYRENTIKRMAEDIVGLEEASAWCFVHTCKSVSQTLHTATVPTLSPLFDFYLSCPEPSPVYLVIKRVLTALLHHVKDEDRFSPLADILVQKHLSSGSNILPRNLELLAIPLAVRKGVRLSKTHITTLLSQHGKIPLDTSDALRYTSALLIAGDMSLWVSHGRQILERCWEMPSFAVPLCGSLAELGWGGWKTIALPIIIKKTPTVLDSNTLALLAYLHREKLLVDVDIVWKKRVGDWVVEKLKDWSYSEASALELEDIISLSSFIPGIAPLIIDIVNTILAKSTTDFMDSPANSSWILGTCLKFLATCPRDIVAAQADLSRWITLAVENWSWSELVLAGIVVVSQSIGSKNLVPVEEVYPRLKSSIMSHSHPVRLNTLKLLTSSVVECPLSSLDVFKRCLRAEQATLDAQGVRERVLHIGRIGQAVRSNDEIGIDACVRWLLAQLKVNLRPIWSPALAAIGSLSSQAGDSVWAVAFDELKSLSQGQFMDSAIPEWNQFSSEDQDQIEDDPWEEEKSWRDPSAHKLRLAVSHWLDIPRFKKQRVKDQQPPQRFVIKSYEAQVLAVFVECRALSEKHNRELISLFLSLQKDKSPLPRYKLLAWLGVFSNFANPKAIYATNELHALYLSLLSHPDRQTQNLALTCLLSYKDPHLLAHESRIQMLFEDSRWRDELTSLDFNQIDPPERKVVVDVVTRILFGLMLERRGRGHGADKRAAVLTTLSGCTVDELGLLVDLMLGSMGTKRDTWKEGDFVLAPAPTGITPKQQIGFLTLLGDVLKNMGSRLVPYWPSLVGTTIQLCARAQAVLQSTLPQLDVAEAQEDEEEAEDEADETSPTISSKMARQIRQLSLKRLVDFFRCPVEFDFEQFMPTVFSSVISPRLPAFSVENTQAPSALLGLFSVWATHIDYTSFLWRYDPQVLPQTFNCLVAVHVKPETILCVFDIIDSLLSASANNHTFAMAIQPHVPLLLANLSSLLERRQDVAMVATPLGQRLISVLSRISHFCQDTALANGLQRLLIPLLRKSPKAVPERVKVDLLASLTGIIPLVDGLSNESSLVYKSTYDTLSRLFLSLRFRSARTALTHAFDRLAQVQAKITTIAELLGSLNAFSNKRLDEPDFDRRLSAFTRLNSELHSLLTAEEWLPLVYNMLLFIQDPTELSIRANATHLLRLYVDRASEPHSDFEIMFSRVVYPGLKRNLRSKHDFVRAEVLAVIAHAVSKCSNIPPLVEMRPLLAGGDEEASIFSNIHHVQVHRRTRALRRLAEQCESGGIRSSTIADVLLPLVQHFITASDALDHHLVNEAIQATGKISKCLSWGAYYALVQKYTKFSKDNQFTERVHVRTLLAILDGFHFSMEATIEGADTDHEEEGEDDDGEGSGNTAKDSAIVGKITDAVNLKLLPTLIGHLEKHDASTEDNARIPIAAGIVIVAQHLPTDMRATQINRLLTVLSQVFRSKSQETRDLARDTLSRISVTLGQEYLADIVRELRAALTRGPQLHVLAYVVHHLLVHLTTGDHANKFSVLDDAIDDIAFVSAEVIFGESGKDVQTEGFKTKMREVRGSSSKGLDSFGIISKFVTPTKIGSVLAPLRSIMHETATAKILGLVDEVLKRVANGLNSNSHLTPSELLVLCHTLIKQNAKFLQQIPVQKNAVKGDAIVQIKRNVVIDSNHYASNSYRFVAFGLDLMHTALRRNRFDFKDSGIIARLESMVTVVGNTLYSSSTSVLVLGMKVAAGLCKCPLKTLDKSLPVIIRQILDVIQQVGNTESEVVQTAFKALAAILRDGPPSEVKEKDLLYLVELITPDLEDPTRQATVFTLLRAIISRKFVVPEIYDLMDKVSEVMVTSQSPSVQEMCRSVLLQFLLDYPQGKGRLRKQMTFLVKNLSYVHESGRRSVMELLGAVIAKFQENLVQEYADMIFVGLVMAMANDDSAKCKETAAQLTKSLLSRLDEEQISTIISLIHSWARQEGQEQLVWVALHVYGLVIEALSSRSEGHISLILQDIRISLEQSAATLASMEKEEDGTIGDALWQVPYHALIVLSKIFSTFPKTASELNLLPWSSIIAHLLFPHTWVRTAACRLLGALFTVVPFDSAPSDVEGSPVSDDMIQDVAKKLCLELKSEYLDEPLGLQVVKNLFYISKRFALHTSEQDEVESEDDAEDEESPHQRKYPLSWLASKLSYQMRSALIARRSRKTTTTNWYHQPIAILRFFAALTSHLPPERVRLYLVHILTPIYRITDDDTIRDPKMDELKALAIEVQELVQSKVGVTVFSNVYSRIRQGVLDIRRERKAAQALQASANPEAAAKRKLHKNTIKKESRKRKNRVFADSKGQSKRFREEA